MTSLSPTSDLLNSVGRLFHQNSCVSQDEINWPSVNSSLEEQCRLDGGEWKWGAKDYCYFTNFPLTITASISQGCDCGFGRCWLGREYLQMQPKAVCVSASMWCSYTAEPLSSDGQREHANSNTASKQPKMPTSPIVVNSVPSGAEIFLNDISTGKVTPARIDVPADDNFSITLKLSRFIVYTKQHMNIRQVGHSFSVTLQRSGVIPK